MHFYAIGDKVWFLAGDQYSGREKVFLQKGSDSSFARVGMAF